MLRSRCFRFVSTRGRRWLFGTHPVGIFWICCWAALLVGCANNPRPGEPGSEAVVAGAVVSGDIPRLHLHLISGGSPDQRDEEGQPLLVLAAGANQVRAVEMLLAHGADISLAGPDGETAPEIAWRNGVVDVFRVFLENGVDISSVSQRIEACEETDPGPARQRIREMIPEAALYRSITLQHREAPVALLDRYLSLYPDGTWSSTVQDILLHRVNEDLDQLGQSREPAAWRSFLRRYGEMGNNRFAVDATTLNIRQRPEGKADVVGRLSRGDRVHAATISGEWIDTGTGWVHRRYLSPDPVKFSFLKPFLECAGLRLQVAEGRTPVKRSRSVAKSQEPETIPSRSVTPTPTIQEVVPDREPEKRPEKIPDKPPPSPSALSVREEAERDFEAVMSSPTLPLLEAFILKYAKNARMADLVDRARIAYKDRVLEP